MSRVVFVAFMQNVNLVLVLAGFVALEVGIVAQWSVAIAAMVGGSLLMVAGLWPYLTAHRKRKP